MKGSWLTLLREDPPIGQFAEDLANASFEVLDVPIGLDGGVFRVQCGICGHQMQAWLHFVDPAGNGVGKRIIEGSLVDVGKAPDNRDSELVMEHLRKTRFVVQSSEPFIAECDCEFRFHQAMASGHYLWYVDGRGFADEVETWLEFEGED